MTNISNNLSFTAEHLLKRGFVIFQSNKLKDLAGIDTFDCYKKNLQIFRKKLRTFFELDLSVKLDFEASATYYIPELNAFGSGWWPESKFPDPLENVDYDIQYVLSKVYNQSIPSELFNFDIVDSKSQSIGNSCLPMLEGGLILSFLNEFVLKQLSKDLAANLCFSFPKLNQQFEIAYYPREGLLPTHTDTPFLMGNIGKTQNLYILPYDTRKPYQVILDEGEVLLYTGRQFRKIFASVDCSLPTPMPHWVNGRKGRIAILLYQFTLTLLGINSTKLRTVLV